MAPECPGLVPVFVLQGISSLKKRVPIVLKYCKTAEATIQSNWDHFYMHKKQICPMSLNYPGIRQNLSKIVKNLSVILFVIVIL